MTAIELLFFIIRLSCGVGLSIGLWTVNPLLGGLAGIGFFLVFPKLVALFVKRFGDKPIGKPPCCNRCCNDDDYKWTRSENGLPICKCKCGYEFVADGNRFLKIDSEGQKRPYMAWSKKEGWVKDE